MPPEPPATADCDSTVPASGRCGGGYFPPQSEQPLPLALNGYHPEEFRSPLTRRPPSVLLRQEAENPKPLKPGVQTESAPVLDGLAVLYPERQKPSNNQTMLTYAETRIRTASGHNSFVSPSIQSIYTTMTTTTTTTTTAAGGSQATNTTDDSSGIDDGIAEKTTRAATETMRTQAGEQTSAPGAEGTSNPDQITSAQNTAGAVSRKWCRGALFDIFRRQAKRSQFYKTRICPWVCSGKCVRGTKCNYAHADAELRRAPDLSRTRLCPVASRGGLCCDGRCRFAHLTAELRATDTFYKTRICRDWKFGKCAIGDSCRMAHGSSELRWAGKLHQLPAEADPFDPPNATADIFRSLPASPRDVPRSSRRCVSLDNKRLPSLSLSRIADRQHTVRLPPLETAEKFDSACVGHTLRFELKSHKTVSQDEICEQILPSLPPTPSKSVAQPNLTDQPASAPLALVPTAPPLTSVSYPPEEEGAPDDRDFSELRPTPTVSPKPQLPSANSNMAPPTVADGTTVFPTLVEERVLPRYRTHDSTPKPPKECATTGNNYSALTRSCVGPTDAVLTTSHAPLSSLPPAPRSNCLPAAVQLFSDYRFGQQTAFRSPPPSSPPPPASTGSLHRNGRQCVPPPPPPEPQAWSSGPTVTGAIRGGPCGNIATRARNQNAELWARGAMMNVAPTAPWTTSQKIPDGVGHQSVCPAPRPAGWGSMAWLPVVPSAPTLIGAFVRSERLSHAATARRVEEPRALHRTASLGRPYPPAGLNLPPSKAPRMDHGGTPKFSRPPVWHSLPNPTPKTTQQQPKPSSSAFNGYHDRKLSPPPPPNDSSVNNNFGFFKSPSISCQHNTNGGEAPEVAPKNHMPLRNTSDCAAFVSSNQFQISSAPSAVGAPDSSPPPAPTANGHFGVALPSQQCVSYAALPISNGSVLLNLLSTSALSPTFAQTAPKKAHRGLCESPIYPSHISYSARLSPHTDQTISASAGPSFRQFSACPNGISNGSVPALSPQYKKFASCCDSAINRGILETVNLDRNATDSTSASSHYGTVRDLVFRSADSLTDESVELSPTEVEIDSHRNSSQAVAGGRRSHERVGSAVQRPLAVCTRSGSTASQAEGSGPPFYRGAPAGGMGGSLTNSLGRAQRASIAPGSKPQSNPFCFGERLPSIGDGAVAVQNRHVPPLRHECSCPRNCTSAVGGQCLPPRHTSRCSNEDNIVLRSQGRSANVGSDCSPLCTMMRPPPPPLFRTGKIPASSPHCAEVGSSVSALSSTPPAPPVADERPLEKPQPVGSQLNLTNSACVAPTPPNIFYRIDAETDGRCLPSEQFLCASSSAGVHENSGYPLKHPNGVCMYNLPMNLSLVPLMVEASFREPQPYSFSMSDQEYQLLTVHQSLPFGAFPCDVPFAAPTSLANSSALYPAFTRYEE